VSPKVFIVILNWNGIEDTKECLDSLSKLKYDNFNVVVVENGSTDGSAEILREEYPHVEVIENRVNLGFTRGSNVGMRHGMERRAEYLWLLNNDTVVDEEALSEMVRYGESSKQQCLLSPQIYYYDDCDTLQFRGSVVNWKDFTIRKCDTRSPSRPQVGERMTALWGTALLIKRGVIEEIGYLDEKYFAYYEDEDYCLRALKEGFECAVVPEAKIYHKDSMSTGGYTAPMQVFLRSRNYYFLWMDKVSGFDRVKYFFRSVANTVNYGGLLREKGLDESMDACVDGLWSAIKEKGGPIEDKVAMPSFLKSLFKGVFFRNSYFWSCLLRGEMKKIVSRLSSFH
jgi:GT2 family glycosyltransferase